MLFTLNSSSLDLLHKIQFSDPPGPHHLLFAYCNTAGKDGRGVNFLTREAKDCDIIVERIINTGCL